MGRLDEWVTYCIHRCEARRLDTVLTLVPGLNMLVEDLGIPNLISIGHHRSCVAYPSHDVPKPI